MLSIRKFLFKTGDRMMTLAFLLGLFLPVLAEKFGFFKKLNKGGGGTGQGIAVAFGLGFIGFLLFLPITAPLLGFGWMLVRLSCLDSASDVPKNS